MSTVSASLKEYAMTGKRVPSPGGLEIEFLVMYKMQNHETYQV